MSRRVIEVCGAYYLDGMQEGTANVVRSASSAVDINNMRDLDILFTADPIKCNNGKLSGVWSIRKTDTSEGEMFTVGLRSFDENNIEQWPIMIEHSFPTSEIHQGSLESFIVDLSSKTKVAIDPTVTSQ